MTPISGSGLAAEVNLHIRGSVGRIGGTVDQLLDYAHCTVTDINVTNLRRLKYSRGPIGALRYGFDLLEQEVRFYRKGWHAVRDRKTCWMDIHKAVTSSELHNTFDAVVSSNVAEHSFNAMYFFLCTWLLCKKGGWQYHAIPCNRFTFDRYRIPTSVDHFIEDFQSGRTKEDARDAETHFEDFRRSAEKSGWPVNERDRRMPHLHYHVFDEHTTMSLLSTMFEDVKTDIHQIPNKFNDVVVLFRNELRADFIERYAETAEKLYGITLRRS